MATKKKAAPKRAKKGGVRISELASKGKKLGKKKLKASPAGKAAYRFVTENVAGSPLQKLQRTAVGVLNTLQKKVSEVLSGDPEGDEEVDYGKLRRQWIKKRIKRSLKRKG